MIVVEYNAKFPPPIHWTVRYDPACAWAGDDYQGASSQSFADLFGATGYRLVACNLTGVNAYFMSHEFKAASGSCSTSGAIPGFTIHSCPTGKSIYAGRTGAGE